MFKKNQIYNEFSNMFTGIGCFKSTISLKVKEDAKPYLVTPIDLAYTLQEPF